MRRPANFMEQVDRAPLTYVCILAYLTMAALTGLITPDGEKLLNYGAGNGALIQGGEPWRLLSHSFLHGGFLHLGFNTYFLLLIGPGLEMRLGSLRFALLYVVTAIGGAVTALLWNGEWYSLLVGGSGAIFGMLGAMVAMNVRQGRHKLEFLEQAGPRSLITLIVINLVLGLIIEQISNSAHIGGLITGFVLAYCFLERGRYAADGLTRLLQVLWALLFLSCTAYTLRPVLRWDYRYLEYVEIEDGERRAELSNLLLQQPGYTFGGGPERLEELGLIR